MTDTAIVPTSQLIVQAVEPGKPIVANYDELEAWVDSQIAAYAELVVTPDYVKQAKNDRAECNAIDKRINDARLGAQRVAMEPVEDMKARLEPIREKVRKAAGNIDRQIKAFEDKEKDDKRAAIEAHWNAFAGILAEHTPFEVVFDPKWLNKTPTLKTVCEEIERIVEKAAADEATLSELALAYPEDAKARFLATLDLAAAIQHSKDLEAQHANTVAFETSKAGISATRAPAPPAFEDMRPGDPVSFEGAVGPTASAPGATLTPPRTWTVEVFCTRAQLDGMIDYLKVQGITGRAVG